MRWFKLAAVTGGRIMQMHLSLLVGAAIALAPIATPAHSLSFLEGDAVVHRDKVELKLDVRPEDILLSAGTSFIAVDPVPRADLVKGAEAHRKFLLDGIVIRTTDGQPLSGRITKVEMPTLPEAGIPVSTLMTNRFVYQLEYPLLTPPAQLGFQQKFDVARTATPVIMQLRVMRAGQTNGPVIPVPTGVKPGVVAFDWTNATQAATVAALALEPTEAFLYIQNEEVRVEILLPLRTLETWRPVPRADPEVVEVAEQTASLPALQKWFVGFNELKIDGMQVKPKLDRLDYYGVDFKDFAARVEPKRLKAALARVGAILTYSTKGPPRHIELKWNMFNEQAANARVVVIAYDQGRRIEFSPAQATYTWDNPGVPPVAKVEAVSTQRTATDAAAHAALAETLLRNVYRGFDYHSESDIYDALAQSVQGELLTDLYLKIKQGLTVQEQGGAMARVREVKVIKSEPLPGAIKNGFAERVTWQIEGTVEHWGHIHTRINEYTADLGIAPVQGAWKIASLSVVKQSQVKSIMSVRKL